MTRIGYTSGVFDLLHPGHIERLRRARATCDYLIVAISTDQCVESYKQRLPIYTFGERVAVVSAIKYVDRVVPQPDMDKVRAWQRYGFHVLIIGDDGDQNASYGPYLADLKSRGVEIMVHSRLFGLSTTGVLRRIIDRAESLRKLLTKGADR